MALGNGNYHNNNNRNNNNFDPSYYSRIRIKNPNEGLSLSFTYWKGTLKITISDISSPDNVTDLAYIHLSPTKARILSSGVDKIIYAFKNKGEDIIFGVDTGIGNTRGFIAIGLDRGVPYLFIAKVNSDGSYESSQRFTFNMDYNYILVVHDLDNLKCQKNYLNDVELITLRDILDDYSRFASGAAAASFYDIGRYEAIKSSNLIKQIGEKLGVRNYNSGNRNNSAFDNADRYDAPSESNPNSRQPEKSENNHYTSIDDLEREMM